MNSFQKHISIFLECQELDIVGKHSSVKKPSELGPEKRFYYKCDTHHFNLVVVLNICLSFFGGLRHFLFMFVRFRNIR